LGLSALSRVQQREFDAKSLTREIVVSYVHPGYISTGINNFSTGILLKKQPCSSVYAAMLPLKTDLRGILIWLHCQAVGLT